MSKIEWVEGQESVHTAVGPTGYFCSASLFSDVDKDVCVYSTRLSYPHVWTLPQERRNILRIASGKSNIILQIDLTE
jgi:hypothetical protein